MKNNILVLLFLISGNIVFAQTNTTKITENRFLQQVSNKYGLVDSLNNIVIPFNYDEIRWDDNRLIVRYNSHEGVLSLDNEELIPIKYKNIDNLARICSLVQRQNTVLTVCDSTEKKEFYITQNDENLKGVYDYNGKKIIPEEYRFYTLDGYKIFASKGNQSYILDVLEPNNSKLLGPGIDFVETRRHLAWNERFFQIVKKQNKYGLINANNQIIIPLIYEEVSSADTWSHYVIKLNGKIGLINVKGEIVREPIYDRISLRKEHVVLYKNGMKEERYSYRFPSN